MIEIAPFAEAVIRTTTPLLLASMGELVTERAGVINIGLEGCIIAGAYAAFVAGGATPWTGYGAAALAGGALGLVLAFFCVALRRDQIITGTALTMLALGITGTLFRARGDAAAMVATQSPVHIPLFSDIPLVGAALFAQPAITYVAFALAPGVWWALQRTHVGLAVRALGDAPEAARAAGVRVRVVKAGAILFGATLGGLAGGALVLAHAGSFAEGMSAGRGFLAIAIVALGRWRAGGVAAASLVFGGAMSLQFVVQAAEWNLRYEIVLMIPYLLTLAALGVFWRSRGFAPAMLGRTPTD